MFLIDDIILFPIKGIYHLARQVKEQAEEEFFDEAGTKHKLNELYMMLETGSITEEEFSEREEELIAHLERIQEYKNPPPEETQGHEPERGDRQSREGA